MAKQIISWPLVGGLETGKSPLQVQPGSHLQLDNVTQERDGEWRRRNGFTQSAADTATLGLPSFSTTQIGAEGLVALGTGDDIYKASVRAPNFGTRWKFLDSKVGFFEEVRKYPGIACTSPNVTAASVGSLTAHACVNASGSMSVQIIDDEAGVGGYYTIGGGGFLRVRSVATASYAAVFLANATGDLTYYIFNASGGASGSGTLTTGLHATQPYLDTLWYGGSTVTVVARTAANAVRFIEVDLSTGTKSTDLLLAGVSCDTALALLADASSSGTRFVVTSHSTPTTRVVRVSSAGAVLTNDQVEAVASSKIAGIASSTGANWDVVYQASTGLRQNYKSAGVVASPTWFRNISSNSSKLTIDSMGWAENGSSYRWCAIIGLHTNSTTDPVDTWIQFSMFMGSSYNEPGESLVPLQAAQSTNVAIGNSFLFQAVRHGTGDFRVCLPLRTDYGRDGTTQSYDYTSYQFRFSRLSNSVISIIDRGSPIGIGESVFCPGKTGYIEHGAGPILSSLGMQAPPLELGLAQSVGGGLGLLKTYGYTLVYEVTDSHGKTWRSPPSTPAIIALTGGNNRVTVTSDLQDIDDGRIITLIVYRSLGNGSSYRRVWSRKQQINSNNVTFVDDMPDVTAASGDILYTHGELPTAITPPSSRLFVHDDRLWMVNRDFRTELWYSKNLRPGRQPEFTDEGVVDIDDEFGEITQACSIEGRGVIFKKNAIYFIQGSGIDDAGGGEGYSVTRVAEGVGAVVGSPVAVASGVVYFVSEMGIQSIDSAAKVEFVGDPVDRYLRQPLVQTQEVIYDACFIPSKNEVRFVTTNYVLVLDRRRGTWSRWTGLTGMRRCVNLDGDMALFKTNGTMWIEGDHTQLTDQGTSFLGIIRMAWIRAKDFSRIRLFRGLATAIRTSGGATITPSMQVFLDGSDTQAQSLDSAGIVGTELISNIETRPQVQNCSSFSLQITLPNNDNTFRLDKIGAEVMVRGGGAQKRTASERWT